jgi:biopolymer transport protein ExbD
MADMENTKPGRQRTGKWVHKKSTKVDLTPMVDLGFLLLTFFVCTTSMARPKVMKLFMPDDQVQPDNHVCASCVLTVLLTKDNTVLYYEGAAAPGTMLRKTSFSTNGIRQIILNKIKTVEKKRSAANQLVLIIKPTQQSSLQNFVDIMDEVAINGIKLYYLDEASPFDLEKVKDARL